MDNDIALNDLPFKKGGYITSIDIENDTKRRLLDLGVSVGKYIIPLFESPLGDPVAYSIMGSVIAMRKNLSSHIMVREAISDD